MDHPGEKQSVGEKANRVINFYRDSLSLAQYEVLCNLAGITAQSGFYLAGGTALAIQLRHRKSLDLDWFSSNKFSDPMAYAQALRDAGVSFVTDQTAPGALHGRVQEVRVSFLEFRYPLLSQLMFWSEPGIQLASLDDLACMKLSAIVQRGSKKDFFDVYALCLQHRPLQQILELYQKKFAVEDLGPAIYGLVYFDDAEDEPDPQQLIEIKWDEVKKAFQGWVKEMR